ncbi:MAG TPA: hypothetical protein VIH17_01425 [Candidatus Acidoferrales bacterium]
MQERDFYTEEAQRKPAHLVCPHCRQEADYEVRWLVRTKKNQLPPHANDQDRAQFAKARSYMVRAEDLVMCKNIRCRKRIELTGQTVLLL